MLVPTIHGVKSQKTMVLTPPSQKYRGLDMQINE